MAPSFGITDDADLHTRVRAETNYEDTADELPSSRLDTLTRDAKLTVFNELGRDDWFDDVGVGEMLLGVLCIKCKASLENFSVSRWDLGNTSVTVADDQGESIQIDAYMDMIRRGKQAMEGTSDRNTNLHLTNTANYIGGRR